MKIRYTGETSFLELTNGDIYEVVSVERGWYRVVDAGVVGLMLGGDRVSFSIVPLSASLVKFPCSMWNRVGRVDIINRLT